jgi:uncharacterized protein (TIRG00374 family)
MRALFDGQGTAAEGDGSPTSRRGPGSRLLRLLVGALSLGVFVLVLYVGGVEAWRRVLQADPVWVGVAFACTALLTYISAVRWGLIANSVAGARLCSMRAYYHYLMMGKTVGLILPEAVGVYTVGPLAMKAEGRSSFVLAFGTLFLDKLFDLVLSGLLLFPVAAYALRLVSLEVCAALFGVLFAVLGILVLGWYGPLVGGAFVLRARLVRRSQSAPWLRRLLQGRLGQQLLALRVDQVPPARIAALAYGFTVLRYLLMTARFAAVSQAVGVDVPPLLVFVGIPIAQLGLLLSVTPGALGALEAGWLGVLLLAGLPRTEIATFLIGQRAALFVFIFTLGLLSYLGRLIFPFEGDGVRRSSADGRRTTDE